jgi:hypothetical protein
MTGVAGSTSAGHGGGAVGGASSGTGGSAGTGGTDGGGGGADAPPDGPLGCQTTEDCTAVTDACNIGVCHGGVCEKAPINEGDNCDDGLFCTENDVGTNGTCAGTPKICPVSDSCHVTMCDEPSKMCTIAPGNDGGPCVPSNKCFVAGFCDNGACMEKMPPLDCSFLDDTCNTASCDPTMGCVKTALPDGNPCNDGLGCTDPDVCMSGTCVGTPTVCSPSTDACKVNQCVEPTGCELSNATDGTACSMNECKAAETCKVGVCGGGQPANQGMPCTNSQACMTNNTCDNGTCSGAPITACVGGDGCCPAGCTPVTDSDCFTCQSVLLVGTDLNPPNGLILQLEQAVPALCTIDYLDVNNTGTPTLAALKPYQALLVYNGNQGAFTDPVGLGNVVASYFDSGGQVVVALFADGGYALTGNWTGHNYNLIVPASVLLSSDSFSSANPAEDLMPTSPVLVGVNTITVTNAWHGNLATANGGTPVAKWASGDVLAVTGIVTDASNKPRNRVDLNIAPTDIINGGVYTGDAVRLLANALFYQ